MIENRNYQCVCGNSENILRPYLGQIPAGWMQFGDEYICNECKMEMMLAAFAGAHKKVVEIKERRKDFGY